MDFERKLNQALADWRHARRTAKEEAAALKAAESHVEAVRQAQDIAQRVAELTQEAAHGQISSVVTRCLRAVFGEGCHSFRIAFERKRGRTEARLLFVNSEGMDEDPGDAACGGMIDVAAFALRLACLMLSRPRKRLLIMADEPMKNVNGEEYQERVGALILELARETGVQFLIVSDDDFLKVGKVVEL